MNKKEINGQNSAATSAQEIVNLFKKAYEGNEWQPTITIGDYKFALQKPGGLGWYLIAFKGNERIDFRGSASRFDGKDHRWGKALLEHTANTILDFLAMENNYGFVCEEQYDDVMKAISDAAIVDFTAPDDIQIRTEYDYITVNIDGLEFDIDLSDEIVKNITCDYPMGMYEIKLINQVNANIGKIYEAGRKCFEKEINA